MAESSAEMSLEENLSLFEVNRRLLAEIQLLNNQTLQQLQLQDEMKIELQKLTYLLNAFTSGGTPHRSYSPDHLLTAYLALVGPALGGRISKENGDPAEILKAGIIIARDMLEELNSYNQSTASGQEAIKKALQFSTDPWQENEEPSEEDINPIPEDQL